MNEQYHAKTLKGLEQILAAELAEIGAEDVVPVNRGVDFSGSRALLYKANVYLRTALRILVPISRFKAINEDQVYRNISRLDWSEYMTFKNSFAVDVVSFSRVFRNSLYLEQKVKDAIVDQFRSKTSVRPSVDIKNPEIRINVHVQETFFTVSLDSSGASLHKRGYRKESHPASLSEVLAAGIVLMTGWKGDRPLLNPMCGSGTIAIEAAMIACNMYPGITGRRYAFQHWPDYDEELFDRLLENMPPIKPLEVPIYASDIDREAVRISIANARQLELHKEINIKQEDFFSTGAAESSSLLIMNPPYGERLKMEDIHHFYEEIGSTFKHRFPGSEAWLFTANLDAALKVGLKPDRKITLFNGGLECRLMKYTLFSGKRKAFVSP